MREPRLVCDAISKGSVLICFLEERAVVDRGQDTPGSQAFHLSTSVAKAIVLAWAGSGAALERLLQLTRRISAPVCETHFNHNNFVRGAWVRFERALLTLHFMLANVHDIL